MTEILSILQKVIPNHFAMLSSRFVLYFIIALCTLNFVAGSHHHHKNHNTHRHSTEENKISKKELRRVSEELFDMLPSGIYHYLNINYQGQRSAKDTKDEAPEPLFIVPKDLYETNPTIQALYSLYDNYNIDSLDTEDVTPEEIAEENAFVDRLLDTTIMIHTMDFLAKKGYFAKDLETYKNVLKKIWFQQYARSNKTNIVASSGFEHVFLVEKKHSHIIGLHNWIFFATEEYDNKANYLGYIKKKQLSDKAAVIKFYVSYLDKTKLTSMFIGTLPEFEISLYTLCFYARPNLNCNILLGGVKITLQSWVQYKNNEKLIGSAYPKIY